MRIAVIGAGAAGCFCAAELKRLLPEAETDLYEAGPKPLAKVALTGGGRCNLTNTFEDVKDLSAVYPRGGRLMGRLFHTFSPEDTRHWFEEAGVALKEEEGGRIFPVSDDAGQIVRTLLRRLKEESVRVHTGHKLLTINTDGNTFTLGFEAHGEVQADAVVVTTGGSPSPEGLSFLHGLGVETVAPVPSLFSLNIPDIGLRALSGSGVADATVSIPGTKFKAGGALLVTYRGLSGPAVLRLSSHAARYLAEKKYRGEIRIDWLGTAQAEDLLAGLRESYPDRLVRNARPEAVPARLWAFLADRSGLPETLRWKQAGTRQMNAFAERLRADTYRIDGKSPNGAEFVTCGGVSLGAVDQNTLEAKAIPGLYFAGEVLDIDALTGGFNLQAAWTTGFRAARSIAEKTKESPWTSRK